MYIGGGSRPRKPLRLNQRVYEYDNTSRAREGVVVEIQDCVLPYVVKFDDGETVDRPIYGLYPL